MSTSFAENSQPDPVNLDDGYLVLYVKMGSESVLVAGGFEDKEEAKRVARSMIENVESVMVVPAICYHSRRQ